MPTGAKTTPASARAVAPARGGRGAYTPELDRPSAALEDKILQLRAGVRAALGGADPRATAARGLAGSGGDLPHAARIQAAFGRHDVSQVRAFQGDAATDACDTLGAHGFTLGDRVALRAGSDLFTAAHEAAHVVQQRSGIALSEGHRIGRTGDTFERHADQVAARVVAGQSASDLLDRFAGSGRSASPAGVQLRAYTGADDAASVAIVRGVLARGVAGEMRALHDAMVEAAATRLPPGNQHHIQAQGPTDVYDLRLAPENTAALAQQLEQALASDASDAPGELREAGNETTGGDAATFVAHFNRVFAPILHVFSGGLDSAAATRLFTERQMRQLLAFDTGRAVPHQLFNGAPMTGQLDNRQRILLSAHILQIGTFSPEQVAGRSPRADEGSREGPTEGGEGESSREAQGEGEGASEAPGGRELGANSCRHWGMMVYAYAGLGVPDTSGTDGIWHTVDPTGAIVLSAPGAPRRVGVGSAASARNVPVAGPRRPAPVDDPRRFEAGDWLEIAWRGTGGHTVVFERLLWERDSLFRITYSSQNRNDRGNTSSRRARQDGTFSKYLGEGQSVIFAHTAMSGAGGAATSVDELLPGMTGATGADNQGFIQERLRAHAPLDMEHAVRWVCDSLKRDNDTKIGQLGARLGDQQRDLLRTANQVESGAAGLEQLVRLGQRLQHLVENIDLVEANARAQVGHHTDEPYRVAANRWQAPGAGISQTQLTGRAEDDDVRRSGRLADLADGAVPWGSYRPAAGA